MKQLTYSITNELDEFNLIQNSKRKASITNLENMKPQLIAQFNEYSSDFNNIHTKGLNSFNVIESIELKNCYENNTAALENLKAKLINAQTKKFKYLCPYCLIINHTTFDHYIPKEEYPVYSVFAKNLVPCCVKCNGKKLEYWREDDDRAIIHFYIEDVNVDKFLFCEIHFSNNLPVLNFQLRFNAHFDKRLKSIIEKHFARLELLSRYDNEVSDVISDIETDIKSLAFGKPTFLEAKDFLLRKSYSLFEKCGQNYWVALAYQELATSDDFINSVTQ